MVSVGSMGQGQEVKGQGYDSKTPNILLLVGYRLFLLLVIYTLCRLAFFYNNRDLLEVSSLSAFGRLLLGGLRYDISAICWINLVWIALQMLPFRFMTKRWSLKLMSILYFILNLPFIVMNLVDVVYFRFTLHRTGISVFKEFSNENPLMFLRFLVDYWPLTVLGLVLLGLWIWVGSSGFILSRLKGKEVGEKWLFPLSLSALLVILVTCMYPITSKLVGVGLLCLILLICLVRSDVKGLWLRLGYFAPPILLLTLVIVRPYIQVRGVSVIGLMIIVAWGVLHYFYSRKGILAAGTWVAERRGVLYSLIWIVVVLFAFYGKDSRLTFSTTKRMPITLDITTKYTERPEQHPMVINTPFSVLYSYTNSSLKRYEYFTSSELKEYYSSYKKLPDASPYSGQFEGRNVVLIIWESFAREWVGALNKDIEGYEGYTPFIDSIIPQAYTFTRAYANGSHSQDAMPSILASILKPGTTFVNSIYAGNDLTSIANRLKRKGYYTAFFHNARNGSLGFDALAYKLGFDDYFGMSEFNDDSQFDGMWGIWDEPFLQFVSDKIGTFKEPFVAVEFTTSSHHPFAVPEKYEGVFPKGEIPLHQCIGYTDYSLKRFFESAKQQSWYENTIFIITADHAVPGVLDRYKTMLGKVSIPIIIFDPKGGLIGTSDEIVQQMDIMPTLLDLLGYDEPIIAFGQNMLATDKPHYYTYMIDDCYIFAIDNYLIKFDGTNVVGLYDVVADPSLGNDLSESHPEVINQHIPFIKAFVQDFSTRMNQDEMHITDRP